MTDMRDKIAGIVRQAIYDHEAYIDSPETIAASAIMALQQARIDNLHQIWVYRDLTQADFNAALKEDE